VSRSQKQYLLDILEAMDDARSFTEDMTKGELKDDRRTRYALQRAFEIIREATKHLDRDLRTEYETVPWDDMAGMRDMIVHEYFAVDLDIVWRTVRKDLPPVQRHLREILTERFDEGPTPK